MNFHLKQLNSTVLIHLGVLKFLRMQRNPPHEISVPQLKCCRMFSYILQKMKTALPPLFFPPESTISLNLVLFMGGFAVNPSLVTASVTFSLMGNFFLSPSLGYCSNIFSTIRLYLFFFNSRFTHLQSYSTLNTKCRWVLSSTHELYFCSSQTCLTYLY